MNLTPIINLATKLIQIPSISPYDLGCQKIIAKKLKKLGFVIEFFNINKTTNMWAYKINGHGKHLNFLGHTDVVTYGIRENWKYDPFSAIIKDGKIFGRGACDMKGSISSMIVAVKNFINNHLNYNGTISFLFTSDEESTGVDGVIKISKVLLSRNQKIDYCIVGEPTSKNTIGDTIKIGRRGSISFSIIIKGISGHVAYPKSVINPIHILSPFLSKLINYKWDRGNKYFPPTSCQITKIISDSMSGNVVPDSLFLEFNIRFSNELNAREIKKIVKNIFYSRIYFIFIKYKIFAKPYLTKKKKLINVVSKVILKHCGLKPKITTSGGTSDGRFLTTLTDQIVELGLVNKTIHKYNECVKINDLKILSVIYEKIIKSLLI